MKLETLEFLKGIVAGLIAYFPTATLAGCISAWIANKMGDDTAEDAGLLTLNPLTHINPFGIALVAIPPHYGFTKGVPINPSNIYDPYKKTKLFVLFFLNFISHFFILFCTLFLISLLNIYCLSSKYLQCNYSSLLIAVVFILKAMINMNIICMVLHFISGVSRSFLHMFLPDLEETSTFVYMAVFLMPIFILILFGPYIEYLLRILLINLNHVFHYLLS